MRRTLSLFALFALALPSVAFAVSTTVVISEFRTRGAAGAADEFVELYNLSGTPVNIGGWTMRGSNNAASVSIRATVPANTIIGPGCHYLICNSGYVGTPAGDLTYATGITDDGGIAILTSGAVIVDQVGMSAGSAYGEGTRLTALLTNVNRGYERKPGGVAGSGQDTDNNTNDFALVQPSAPQNASTACLQATPAQSSTWGQVKILYR